MRALYVRKLLTDKEILEIADNDYPHGDTVMHSYKSMPLEKYEQLIENPEDKMLKEASVELSYNKLRELMLLHLSPREEFCLRSAFFHNSYDNASGIKRAVKRLGCSYHEVSLVITKSIRKLKHPHLSRDVLGPKRKLVL